jgi:hypothetical protein
MKFNWLGGAVVALAVAGMSQGAHATVWLVNCEGLGPGGDTTLTNTNVGAPTANFGTEPGSISGSGAGAGQPDALGALLGTPDQGTEAAVATTFVGTLSSGDIVQVTGTCEQLVEVRTNSITITGPTGNIPIAGVPPTLASPPGGGDSNQVIVNGATRVTFNNFLFGGIGPSPVSFSGDTGYSFEQDGLLSVVAGAQVTLENSVVAFSPGRGIFVAGAAALSLQSSLVTDNGEDQSDETNNSGILVQGASGLIIGNHLLANGTAAGANPSTISNNAGDGIRVTEASALSLNAVTVTGNGQKQLFLLTSSSATLDGNNAFTINGDASLVTIAESPGNTATAVVAEAGSSLFVENQVSITASTTGAAIGVYGSGTALLEGSFISGGTPTIEVTGGALALAGGNYICGGTLASGSATPTCTLPTPYPNADLVIEVDHVGALVDAGAGDGSGFNFTAAADTITGNGGLQLQSTADLGAGLISGNPSLLWTTGSTGAINVSQNSSLRMEGGVSITGDVTLQQGSNGFTNTAKSSGTANKIAGAIYCPFTTVAASHLSIAPGSLTVTPTAPTLAPSYAGALNNGSAGPGGVIDQGECLPF